MPISANTLVIIGLIGLFSAVIAAIVSGIFGLINVHFTSKNTTAIEQLKARLGHGQVVSSTQWNAEFNAYQTLWKSMVPLRGIAHKVVMRESELAELGLEAGDVAEADKIENRKKLLQKYVTALTDCMHAINEHAPFYDADIRKASNDVHSLASVIRKREMSALIEQQKNQHPTKEQATDRDKENREALSKLMAGIDNIEDLIRKRLGAVQVVS